MSALRTSVARWRPSRRIVALIAAVVVTATLGVAGRQAFDRVTHYRLTAEFPSTTGLYVGDDVRVLGVSVGTVDAITPGRESATVTMSLRRGVRVPENAKAVVMATSLVSGRFVQLTPAWVDGPYLDAGTAIPLERTAVPVEWDEIKTELDKLTAALGPQGDDPQGSFGRFVDTAADNLDGGNGPAVNAALRGLADTMSTLADGRTDLFGTVRSLQTFVTALSNSDEQIVQFGGRLATVADVLSSSSDQLGVALTDLDVAVRDVQRFLSANTDALAHSVGELAAATQVLADKRPEIEQILHVAPTALVNFYNLYQPAQGSLTGVFGLNEVANPAAFVCGAIEGTANPGTERTGELCRQYLGPLFNSMVVNYPPIMTNPVSGITAFPHQIEYQPPSVAGQVQEGAR
ncbi:MCE family protein [Rhodococcus gannanensis]|uniref:MCE family protein n=1 Tax=Rhodococcus gannanensis TaxID=1960308 RepID=A0ABW4P4X1_9NOCA